jgi:ParB family transcriptional regulator, chromosome partitioning protein
MARKKLQAALQSGGGAVANVIPRHEKLTDEQMRIAAFEARDNQDASITDKMANDNRRNTLLAEMGFDWFDIQDIQPNPNNSYTITDEDVKNLAGLIYNSKEIEPLILRETENGVQIIDGERRWRACKLLAEKYGDAWRMVPGRCHKMGAISDEQANFIMHSSNIGQRNIKASERAAGFKALADKLVEWRKDDPALKGVNTKTYLAEHFGVSERTAQVLLNIARNLSKEGNDLLDAGSITQTQAEALSKLTSAQQEAVVNEVEKGTLSADEITQLIDTTKKAQPTEDTTTAVSNIAKQVATETANRPAKDINGYLKTARNALRKASGAEGDPDFKLIGEIKSIIRDIERSLD